MAKTKTDKLTSVVPQRRNANKHTQRGLGLLEDSIQRDGWIGAITATADGEVFDGSARTEVGVSAGFDDAIVVETDGTRPVIVKRTDIASADDPKAKRLAVAANRIAQVDLAWDVDVLAEIAAEDDLSDFFTADEFAALAGEESERLAEMAEPPETDNYKEQYGVIVVCEGSAEQERVYNELRDKGYNCRVVVT